MSETLDDIFSVIVFYKTSLKDSATFNSLLNTIKPATGILHVLLYNNSPEITLDPVNYKSSNIVFEVVNDEINSGVSKAYNLAKEKAKKQNRKWLLLLDQDTVLPSDFFSEFLSERMKTNEKEQLCIPLIYSDSLIISPARYFPYRGILKKKVEVGKSDIRKLAIINTGVFVDVGLFEKAGGFNESVKLDFSDISFFRRVKQHCTYAKVMNIKCAHNFSGSEYESYDKTMDRFKIFNSNAIAFSEEEGISKVLLFLTVILRTINLSIKFKTFNFIRELRLHS